MGDQLQQQTRVLLLNGQTIILQGDVGDNSISEINAEILGQALQEAANSTDGNQSHNDPNTSGITDNLGGQLSVSSSVLVPGNHQNEDNLDEDDANNIVAIFENENGETQTVQLTLEQAAALGFQVTSDPADLSGKKLEVAINLVPENEDKVIDKSFNDVVTSSETHLPTTLPTVTSQVTTLPLRSVQPQCSNILGSLLKPSSSPLIYSQYPQYVGNNMTYSVKLPDNVGLDTSSIQVPVSDILPAGTTQAPTFVSASMLSPQMMTNIQPKVTSLVSNQKISIPTLNKNIAVNRNPQSTGPVVRIKPSTNLVSSAIIRPATSKTVIPRIQGTPTSMANLAMSSAQPISSTASMVRVLSSTSTSTAVKPLLSTTVSTTPVKTIDTSSVPRVAANVAKPLGSSENPIQLVQHGQTFHSMQPLSQEQLKQIATVLQQKQLDTSRNSKNVLYDASTNTRIIYRVVYPEDLALKKPTGGSGSGSVSGKGVGRGAATGGRKGRPPKSSKILSAKKMNSDEDEEHVGDNDLSKGEKEERKKVLPRTRSGRLSRPPRHMVKDYKRIHHLDFAEPDLDDSDGGYSDYRISDSEQGLDILNEEMPAEGQVADAVLTSNSGAEGSLDVVTVKRAIHSKFRCPTCQKMYLGYRRLARHFEVYPDHGSMDDVPRGPPPAPTPVPISGLVDSHDGVFESINGGSALRVSVGAGRGRGKRRGLHFMLSPSEKADRRKAKLRELLAGYDPSEVSEVAGPIVAQSLESWQILLLKIGSSEDHPTRLAALVAEMKTLLSTARSKVAKILNSSSLSVEATGSQRVEINDMMVASALNVSCGVYNVSDSDDRKLQWRPSSLQLLNSSSLDPDSLPQPYSSGTLLGEPEAKKQKLWIETSHEIDLDESQTDKSFLETTNESEKPSDTSIGSDTPLDDIVKAELKNLATKSGLDDFVAPPVSAPSSNLGMSQVVDFVTSSFSSPVTDTVSESHFSEHLVMNMPSIVTSTPPQTVTSSLKLSTESMHFELTPSDNHLGLTDNGNHIQNTPSSSELPSENMHFELRSPSSPCRMELNDGGNDLQTPSKLSTENLNFELSSPSTQTHLGTNDQLETPSKLTSDNLHFELTSPSTTSRLELSGGSIDVNLDSHLVASTHELDFEAMSEEFNRNTNS